jgi:hypothetical protein
MIIHFVCLYLPNKFCSGCPPDWLKEICTYYLSKSKFSWHFYECYETESYIFLQMVLCISFPAHLTLDSRGLTYVIGSENESSDLFANCCVGSTLMYNICYLKCI